MGDTYRFVRLGEFSTLLWGYSWLEIETYLIDNLSEGYEKDALFNALLNDKLYKRSYQTPKALEKGFEIHGPFYLSKLSPEIFEKITAEKFSERINDIFHSEYGSPPNEDQVEIARLSESRWLLDKLPKDTADFYELNIRREDEKYHHESWFVLSMFYEFIIIEQSTKKLYLCVLGED